VSLAEHGVPLAELAGGLTAVPLAELAGGHTAVPLAELWSLQSE